MNMCKRVLYQGRVQGVGFRYATHGLARRFAVAGFVKNLPDGRVELVAEGAPAEVDRFLRALAQQMAGHVESAEEHEAPLQGFGSFDIRP